MKLRKLWGISAGGKEIRKLYEEGMDAAKEFFSKFKTLSEADVK